VAHSIAGSLGKKTTGKLSDYEEEINSTIDNRVSEIDAKIKENDVIINDKNSKKWKVKYRIKKNTRLNAQKNELQGAKVYINRLIHKYHGYSITTTTSGIIPENSRGTLRWGINKCNIQINFNGSIKVLIHEAIHVYDIVFKNYNTSSFKSGALISIKARSEINAWRVTFSLDNGDADGVSTLKGINMDFLKRMNYIE
jgi:hypothetical protein